MDYREFVNKAAEDITKYLPENIVVETIQVEKLQGASYYGLSVKDKRNATISASFDLHGMYERYGEENYERFLIQLSSEIVHHLATKPNVTVDQLKSFEWVKNRMMLDVVSFEENKELLSGMVYDRYEDLAAIYRIRIDENATSAIRKDMLDLYQVSEEEFKDAAREYSFGSIETTIKSLTETIWGLVEEEGIEIDELPVDKTIFVATSNGGVNGSGCLFYPGFMEKARKIVGGNFFVLPSSIHEVLIIRDDGTHLAKDLKAMVMSVNAQCVQKADKLSDSLYYVGEDLEFKKIA